MAAESRGTPKVVAGSELRSAIRTAVSKHLDLSRHKLFLFGSESAGTAIEDSDIDIGILGNEAVAGRIMERIRAELETLRTLRRFDVVDFFSTDIQFRKLALRDAEEL